MVIEKPTTGTQEETLLEARGISKSYESGGIWQRHAVRVQALDQLSLKIKLHGVLAIVGESGSGKSTLARCLALMEKPDVGSILLSDEDLVKLPKHRLRSLRPELQMIHQDVATSFNPRF